MTRFEIIESAEASARSVLRRQKVSTFPVEVKQICVGEGLVCVERPLDDELSGMSFIKNGIKYVVVNSTHHPNRQRFTMAHEIGHHMLHSEYLIHNVHVDTGVLRRDELSSEGVYSKEIAANAFAAELLMPRSKVAQLGALDLSDEESVTAAARLFGVSATALTYRLSNLANRSG